MIVVNINTTKNQIKINNNLLKFEPENIRLKVSILDPDNLYYFDIK